MRALFMMFCTALLVGCAPQVKSLSTKNAEQVVNPANAYWMIPAMERGGVVLSFALCQKTADSFRISGGSLGESYLWCDTPYATVSSFTFGQRVYSDWTGSVGTDGYSVQVGKGLYWVVRVPPGEYFLARGDESTGNRRRAILFEGPVPVFNFAPGTITYAGDFKMGSYGFDMSKGDMESVRKVLASAAGPEIAKRLTYVPVGALTAECEKTEGLEGVRLNGREVVCDYAPGDPSVFD